MTTSISLFVEALEARDVPVTFGTPWPDGQHLTLSFAPDGTPIGGTASHFAGLLAALGPAAEMEVLAAFQTWAVQTNVNIGLVSDNGAAFGTGRAVQGDPRFGDIRVGGRTLASDVLAVTTPYALYDNYSGDVVVNTAAPFGPGGYDLYTVLLHEAGHALGIGDNTDPTSAMYEDYAGPRTGLSAGDIAAIQALYGARQPDQYEGATGNNTLATATPYPALGGPVTADLRTASDVDVYKFTAELLTNSITVNLGAAGLSLLTARVDLLDSTGRVVASTVTTDPTQNDLTLSLNSVQAGGTYYVRVSAARSDEFGVGAYTLNVTQSSLLSPVTNLVGNVVNGIGLNTTLATAMKLLSNVLSGPQTEFTTQGTFWAPNVTAWYSFTVPPSSSGASANALVTVWGQNGATLNPWVEVTDALGNDLAAEVITADGNTTTIQVTGLTPGQTYFIKTFSDTQAVGRFTLSADLSTTDQSIPQLAAGTVSGTTSQTTSFALAQTGQVHLVLTATGTSGVVEAVVTNAAGQIVGRFDANADRGRSLDLMLPAGTYTVTVWSVSGAALGFQLDLAIVTDPVGAQPEDPTTTPAPTDPSPTTPTSAPAPPPSSDPSSNPPPPQPTDQTASTNSAQYVSGDPTYFG